MKHTDTKSMKRQSKIDQISIKNRLDPKSTENHQKYIKISAGTKDVAHFVLGAVLEASWARLRSQHSSKLASQIEGKSINNQCKNLSKNRYLPSSSFYAILNEFWRDNGDMLASKSDQKSMPTSKGRFSKND